MSRKPRKHYSAPEKVAILREQLLEGQPISEVCQRHQFQPTVFYAWQKTFFENGAAAFERKNKRTEEGKDRQIAALQEKLSEETIALSSSSPAGCDTRKRNGAAGSGTTIGWPAGIWLWVW